jgi:exodeoxyribonuclease V gamma subunit
VQSAAVPSNLHIVVGNHLELLAGSLARLIRTPRIGAATDPLQPEVVLVQSKGMQRWLSMTIARHNGICANMTFPFPNTLFDETVDKVIGPQPGQSPFDPQPLTFRVMGWLDTLLSLQPFASINDYITGPGKSLKQYQLSGKIADVYDQYLVYRPELIASWEAGRSDPSASGVAQWQALLWTKLVSETDTPHRATLQKLLVNRLRQTHLPVDGLPDRLSVFGISHLPPFHLEVLDALSYRIPVTIFLFNPCRQYWSDIVSEQQMVKERSKLRRRDRTLDHFHFERGNRLLSSWGHQGRQFFGLIDQMDSRTTELFDDNTEGSLLARIQQDILDLVDRTEATPPGLPHQPDRSLRIQACHSPMREVEVLYDQLLDILDENPDIDPADIVIMAPDIAIYAPLVHGVFGGLGCDGDTKIPYSVADQTILSESRVVQAFLALVDLRDSRFEASAVFGLLAFSCIRRHFGLQAADTPLLEHWIAKVNIRWGWNGQDRSRHGLPRFEENTWRRGLDRLLMGYAVTTSNDELFSDIAPYRDGIEGGEGQLLGQFVLFLETLRHHLSRIPASASLSTWSDLFLDIVSVFFDDDDPFTRDVTLLRSLIETVAQIPQSINRQDAVSFNVAHQFIKDILDRSSYGGGFITGGITFCAMLPMRSIPAKVIGILGMQHDSFPRESHEPGFNLMTEAPKPGDRSKRNDDKYLFLEALLSARRVFYLSYVGHDIQDNSTVPPSVLVSELLDYVRDGFGISEGRLVISHPLQAFSPRYFTQEQSPLFSYDENNCRAAAALGDNPSQRPFFDAALPEPSAEFYMLDLSVLIGFYTHSSRFLLEKRLGIKPAATPQSIADKENFNLDGLEQFLARQAILKARTRGKGPDTGYAALHATDTLPHGTFGKAVYDWLDNDVMDFHRQMERYMDGLPPRSAPFTFSAPPFQVTGEIDGIYSGARLTGRLANVRPGDLVHCYIAHLALNLLEDDTTPRHSVLLCKNAAWQFAPLDNAGSILEDLLGIYRQGLRLPLPLLPQSSYEYAYQRIIAKKTREHALAAAQRQWNGNRFLRGECEDEYIAITFGDSPPFTRQFEELAIKFYTPLFGAGQRLPAGR